MRFAGLSLNPSDILDSLGAFATVGLFLIIFAETGLLIGFFLPGDSLLFTAGVLASKGDLNIALITAGVFVAAVVGDQVGYTIGNKFGPALFRRPDSRFFKQKYVERTKAFFEQHGPKTVLLARFVPVVRTFAPVLAGVGQMSRRVFTIYNVIGGFIWAVGVTLAGYLLGEVIGKDDIDKYLLPIIAVIIILSIIPPLIEILRERKRQQAQGSGGADAPPESPEDEVEDLKRVLGER